MSLRFCRNDSSTEIARSGSWRVSARKELGMRRTSYPRGCRSVCVPHTTRLFWIMSSVFFCGLMFSKWLLTPSEIILVNSEYNLRQRLANALEPVILMWTNVWGQDADGIGADGLICGNVRMKCKYTSDRLAMTEASAVLFHARDVYLMDLPSRKYRDQPWVLWNHEAPSNSPLSLYRSMGDIFDLHLTYRSAWDLYSPYGYLSNETDSVALEELDSKALRERFYRQVGAAWLVSDCKTESNREAYVRELKTLFPVTVYGGCGTHSCSKNSNDSCMRDISDKFMFYLSFENSMCPEYVTEKLFRTLQYPIIPVVLSGPRSDSLDSLNAFVDASNLTPKQLATKLQFIGRNFSAYRQYFQWKRNFTAHLQLHPLCKLCEAVQKNFENTNKRRRRKISELIAEDHDSCTRWDANKGKFVPVHSH